MAYQLHIGESLLLELGGLGVGCSRSLQHLEESALLFLDLGQTIDVGAQRQSALAIQDLAEGDDDVEWNWLVHGQRSSDIMRSVTLSAETMKSPRATAANRRWTLAASETCGDRASASCLAWCDTATLVAELLTPRCAAPSRQHRLGGG
jgi:hypothetical protein